jgi:hypothetical protein
MKMITLTTSGAMILLPNFCAFSSWIDSGTLSQIRLVRSCFTFAISHVILCQVVAPVRETVSQTLASLLLHMSRRSVLHVHSILLQMIKQDFLIPSNSSKGDMDVDKGHVWEVRHAGLLGIKYLVAVRSDLFDESFVKSEGSVSESGKEVLRGVVDAAILGCVIFDQSLGILNDILWQARRW